MPPTIHRALCVAAAIATCAGAANAADVGVSVQISEPGVYGRIDIGRFPQPAVIVPQPVVIAPSPTVVVRQPPAYLWVPPGHRKHWAKHCHQYDACGVPVYFVRHDWYATHVQAAQAQGYAGSAPVQVVEGRGPKEHKEKAHGQGHGHGRGRD